MKLHAKTEPLRTVVADLDRAPPYAKHVHARKLMELTIELLADQQHALDRLDKRVETLERFPEVRKP